MLLKMLAKKAVCISRFNLNRKNEPFNKTEAVGITNMKMFKDSYIKYIINPLCEIEVRFRKTVKTVQKGKNFTINPRLKSWVNEN